jgi:hypothetical protein
MHAAQIIFFPNQKIILYSDIMICMSMNKYNYSHWEISLFSPENPYIFQAFRDMMFLHGPIEESNTNKLQLP